MKKLLLLPFLAMLFFSCKPTLEKMIVGKWQATHLDNPTLDEQVKQMNAFLDTVGSHTSPEQNELLYGVKNIDSLKEIQRTQIKQALIEQESAIKNTYLQFKDDGILYYSFGTSPDTACWYFEGENNLVLDEKKLKGVGNIVKIELVKLEKNELQISFHDKGFNSTAVFIPASQ